MKFELNPDRVYLLGILSRVKRREGGDGEIGNLAKYFAFLSAVYVHFNTLFVDIHDIDDFVTEYFWSIYNDRIINLPLEREDILNVSEERKKLCKSKYLKYNEENNSAGLTQRGIKFLHECLNLMENDVSSRGKDSHTSSVLYAANLLDGMLHKLNLNPVIVPSFPLIAGCVQLGKNEKTGKLMRFLIPDLIIKIDADLIPPELGLSRYLAVEVQNSGYDQLAAKQDKYNTLAAKNINSSSPFLYPLYVLRNPYIKKNETERQKFLHRVKKSILVRISDAPEWIEVFGKGISPLLEYPNSFLPFFNIGILDDYGIEFLRWPSASLPRIPDETAENAERGDSVD